MSYALIAGKFPFEGVKIPFANASLIALVTLVDDNDNWEQACTKLMHQTIAEEIVPFGAVFTASRDAQDFILGLLNRDPDSRRNIEECLIHPFITQVTGS